MGFRFFFAFFLLSLSLHAQTQKIATYLFDNHLSEIGGRFPALKTIGKKGKFVLENIPQLGSEKQYVYVFEQSAGLQFVNLATKAFVKDSYTVEMFFRYNDGDISIYNFILGDDAKKRTGQYIHFIFTRDATNKQVKMYLDGEQKHQYIDENNDAAVTEDAIMSFFQNDPEAKTLTSSGAVALIKIYNFVLEPQIIKKTYIDLKQHLKSSSYLIELLETTDIGTKTVLKDIQFYQSTIQPLKDCYNSMDKLAEYLIKSPKVEIELQGHTDNQGDFDLNLRLSRERVEFVKKYIVDRGINENRITTKGFGSTRPIASNTFEDTRRLNRRVEVVITKK